MVYSAGAGGGVGARRSCSAPSALISLVRAVGATESEASGAAECETADAAECKAADAAECDAVDAAEYEAVGCLVIVYQVEDR